MHLVSSLACILATVTAPALALQDVVPAVAPDRVTIDVRGVRSTGETGVMSGIVVDVGGKPVAGALLRVMSDAGESTVTVKTDADGRFAATVIRGGYGLAFSNNAIVAVSLDRDGRLKIQVSATKTKGGNVDKGRHIQFGVRFNF